MKTYRPSNKIGSQGLKWLILTTIIGGTTIGGLTFLVSQLIYLIIMFPVIMGILGGGLNALAIDKGKVRNPLVAAGFGLLMGLSIYGSMNLGNYWLFKNVINKEAKAINNELSQSEIDSRLDEYLLSKTGQKGFIGFMKFSAQQGTQISKVTSQSNSFKLDETGTYIYWLLELGLTEGLIFAMSFGASKKPFCESCDQWYPPEQYLGNVQKLSEDNFVNLIKQENYSQGGKLVNPLALTYPPNLRITCQCCPNCSNSDTVVNIHKHTLGSKGEFNSNLYLEILLSPNQRNEFFSQLNERFDMDLTVINNPQLQEKLVLARNERSQVSVNDELKVAELNYSEKTKITEQLGKYKGIKTAYLVTKEVTNFPEIPCYILAIIRKQGLIESETEEIKLITQLMAELEIPGQFMVICLNKQKELQTKLEAIAPNPMYSSS